MTAFIITLFFTLGGSKQRFNMRMKVVTLTLFTITALSFALNMLNIGTTSSWNTVMICGYFKSSLTVAMYIPQIVHNWKRESTHGWSIVGVMFDFSGGILSLLQMMIENGEFNVGKFSLRLISIGFNIIYIVQHYCLYPDNESREM